MEILGEGRGNLSGKRFPLPSPTPTPLPPKTFDLIESLLTGLPVIGKRPDGKPFGRFLWDATGRVLFFPPWFQ